MSESNVVALPTRSDALIRDGVYRVAFERYELATRFNRGSLELAFKVVEYGDHFGAPVSRYYKVEIIRDGKRKTFRASRHSAYAREFFDVFGKPPPAGYSALHWFHDTYLEAEIRKVTTDHKQRKLAPALQYNVIDALIRRVGA